MKNGRERNFFTVFVSFAEIKSCTQLIGKNCKP